MKQSEFFSSLLPLARKAGEAFRINPAVILAQAAIESGWGQSDLASEHHNYFGLTAYGRSNVWCLPVERGNGSNPRRSRSDSLPPLSPPPEAPHPEADWLGLSGYTLMLAGGIGSLYKVLAG